MQRLSPSVFDSIESAREYIDLLSEIVSDTRRDLDASEKETNPHDAADARLDGFRIAAYDLEKLEGHLDRTRRILSDLCLLRQVVLEGRVPSILAAANGGGAARQRNRVVVFPLSRIAK